MPFACTSRLSPTTDSITHEVGCSNPRFPHLDRVRELHHREGIPKAILSHLVILPQSSRRRGAQGRKERSPCPHLGRFQKPPSHPLTRHATSLAPPPSSLLPPHPDPPPPLSPFHHRIQIWRGLARFVVCVELRGCWWCCCHGIKTDPHGAQGPDAERSAHCLQPRCVDARCIPLGFAPHRGCLSFTFTPLY